MSDWKPSVAVPEGKKPRCMDSLIGKSNCTLHTTGGSVTWCMHKMFDNHLIRAINAMAKTLKEYEDMQDYQSPFTDKQFTYEPLDFDEDEHRSHLAMLIEEGLTRGFKKAKGPGWFIPHVEQR